MVIQASFRELSGWETAGVDGAGTVASPYTISANNPGAKNDLTLVDNSLQGNTDPTFSATYQRTIDP
jgi:hypothetical protein